MFDYKNASFYTEYFNKLDGFSVIENFIESKDENEKNIYVGQVEVLNTIHPLIVRVEIPFTFPHNKLVFRTKSLSGYPHLIPSGKIKYGDWFCLNTPFAETAEEQLDQEVLRLKEWIAHQMREDLPSIIKDENVKHALAFANAYEWENLDEVKEFSSKAMLTFVGNCHSSQYYSKNKMGYLHCVKSPDNRFYAMNDSSFTNHKLPYIIVDEEPSSIDVFSDFIKLKEQYGWDENTCKHLLPDFDVTGMWREANNQPLSLKKTTWNEGEALKQISILEEELNKNDSYLFETHKNTKVKILPSQKTIILSKINEIKNKVEKEHYCTFGIGFDMSPDIDNMTDDELYENQCIDQQIEENLRISRYNDNRWHHFAFGIKNNKDIFWFIFFTNHKAERCESATLDLGFEELTLELVISQPLDNNKTQVITEDMYFGRGSFSENMKAKKIALVGLGAIGSMVASALAHSGISKIGLWDDDIVEPGNICRSSYSLKDLGESKVNAIASIIKSINPYIHTSQLMRHGDWDKTYINYSYYKGGSFYANVNYNTQDEAIKDIKDYDLIIDCTGSNEMLHFLSYAVPNAEIISLCITNHANELLCISSKDGNPFELRKAYLSRIEQDTKNFYIEGSGCYSPTFLASNCDIAALVNLALRELNKSLEDGQLMRSTIYSYTERGIVADKLSTYKLDEYDITLNISSETMYDAEDMSDAADGEIGYILGCYSRDGKRIMITHIVDSYNAKKLLTDAYKTSKGLIDYIGDFSYSGEKADTYNQSSLDIIASKAEDPTINTNNPLLAVRNPDGSISFFLYINNELSLFKKKI